VDLPCVRVSITLRPYLIVCIGLGTIFTKSVIQRHLLHFIYSGTVDRFLSPLLISTKSTTIATTSSTRDSPLSSLPSLLVVSPGLFIEGVYVEMLHSLLRLRLNPVDGSANSAAPVDPTSTIPLTHAATYDTAVKWARKISRRGWDSTPTQAHSR
jgi:hypothetical protein